jgi:hypothetical protein
MTESTEDTKVVFHLERGSGRSGRAGKYGVIFENVDCWEERVDGH